MQDFKKISLSPTQNFKALAPNAVGSVIIQDNQHISLNLFNLPDPTGLPEAPHSYYSWFFNPDSGQIRAIGSLSPTGDNLYLLYDAPVEWDEGFSEVLITAEAPETTAPAGEILLIGYLTPAGSNSLEPFQPFSHPLEGHRWWKVSKTPVATAHRQTKPCTGCTHWQQSCPGYQSPLQERQQLTLPTLIGAMTNESGSIQYIVHGIPGRLLRADQPDQGRTGYLYWQPYYGFANEIGALGYWLCYLDPRTNQVQTPMGVTIPPG